MKNILTNNINKVILGNALDILPHFPARTVDCVITSPPYFNARDYGTELQIWGGKSDCEHDFSLDSPKTADIRFRGINSVVGNNNNQAVYSVRTKITRDGNTNPKYKVANHDKSSTGKFCSKCGAWLGELGLEPNPDLFISHLCLIFDEIYRVMAPTGTVWVNLGDTYSSGATRTMQERQAKQKALDTKLAKQKKRPKPRTKYRSKCLLGIPARFQIAMIEKGWILRNVIIWKKDNAQPSPAKDRFTIDYEYIFFFTKQPKYAFEQQFEPIAEATKTRAKYLWVKPGRKSEKYTDINGLNRPEQFSYNENGRNMRSIWYINTENSNEDHYATFPQKLVKRMILAGCPKNGLVLDPFAGMGTTIKVAKKLGRKGIGIELSKDYCERANQKLAGFRIPAKADEHKTLDNFSEPLEVSKA